jgi:hypothetical protein
MMPKISIDYSNCSIYKLEHIEDETLIYVGHTTNFKQRKAQHKRCCNSENNKGFNFKLYTMMRENGGFEMFKMIEIEKYKCNDKREAEKRENELIKELKATMNKNRSFITEEEHKDKIKQYYEYNKDKINEYNKDYYEDNKDKIKQYREDNKDKIVKKKKEYYEENKDKSKQYYKDNKDKIKQYYEENKYKILKNKKEYYLKKKGEKAKLLIE